MKSLVLIILGTALIVLGFWLVTEPRNLVINTKPYTIEKAINCPRGQTLIDGYCFKDIKDDSIREDQII